MKIQSSHNAPKPTEAKLEGWIFPPIERPAYTDSLKFPDDLTAISLQEVSRLHGRYIGLYAYVVSECSKVNQEVLRIESEMFVRRNNVTRTGLTYGKNKYKIDVEVRADMTLQELQLKRNKAQERKEIIEKFLEIYDRYAQALSREMTRRTTEMQRT